MAHVLHIVGKSDEAREVFRALREESARFDLDVPAGVQPKMAFFAEFPELRASREIARAANLGEVPNNFDLCG